MSIEGCKLWPESVKVIADLIQTIQNEDVT